MISTYVAFFSVAIAIASLVTAIRARRYARDCYEWIVLNNKQSKSLAEIATLSTELTTMKDALTQISKGLRTIRNRMNVRETNARRKVESERAETDDDEEWLKRTNASLQAGHIGELEK